jgi:hypothetical protein
MKCLTSSIFVIFLNVLFCLHLEFLFCIYVYRSCGLDGSYYLYVFFNLIQTVALEKLNVDRERRLLTHLYFTRLYFIVSLRFCLQLPYAQFPREN